MADASEGRTPSRLRTLLAYAVMLVAAVGVYWLIRMHGLTLAAPAPGEGAHFGASAAAHGANFMRVLLALAVVVVAARAVGSLFKLFHQPAVMGEILAGLLLGPSLLGRFAPQVQQFVIPKEVGPFLQVLAQVGVILYMFLVGLELDPGLLRKRGHATVAISHASIIAPFLLGAGLALYAYPRLSSSDVPFSCFALFMGVSMSVTAFPVLARILTDRRIHRTRMGVIALTCAAVDDVSAWCLLALVVGVVQAQVANAVRTFGLALAYIGVIIVVVRPLMLRLARIYGNKGRLTQGVMATVFVALLASSLATELIGIHAVFGAFALGAVIPHDSGLARELTDRLEDLVVVLFLPAFFAFTGTRTDVALVSGAQNWLLCGAILVVACVGKFGGSMIAAKLTGLGWRDSAALGVLMNTRGLMELIVLNIGYELGVISKTMFAMLVLMAVITTFMTTPLLQLITRKKGFDDEAQPEPVKAPELQPRQGGLLVPVSNPVGLGPLLELALAATRPEDPPPRVLALVRRPESGVRSGLRELEGRRVPHAPILADAVARASQRGATITTQAIWTDEPADDIIAAAADPHIGWLLLGFHRPVFGGDLLGGVVKNVLERLDRGALNVGVVVHGHERPLDRVVAVADASDDGRAALELAARVARMRGGTLHAVLVPRDGNEPEPELQETLKVAARDAGRWLHTDVLLRRNPAELAYKARGDLVLIGVALADELGLPLDDDPDAERCIVLVRGAPSTVVPPSEMAKAS